MKESPLLDQVSSQLLRRLAAERGLAPVVVSAGEETVRVRGRRWWMRWLPGFFLVLSVGSLVGMAFGIGALAKGGWSASDGAQLVLMGLLVLSVVTQFRGVVGKMALARFSVRRRPALTPDPSPDSASLAGEGSLRGLYLDTFSADDLVRMRPAELPRARRRAAVRRRGGRTFERVAVIGVVVLGVLAFVGMVAVCGYMAFEHGLGEPGLWLTLPFAGLTGFGSWQVFGSARRAAFRGRPMALVSRAFRDSMRVWGSGSMVSRVAMTTTATASVAGAAAVPAIIGPSTPFDLFVVDSASSALFRVDLATSTSASLGGSEAMLRAVALGSTPTKLTASAGQKLPAGSLVAVFEAASQQRTVAFRPGQSQPILLAQIQPPIPGAVFASGGGTVYAVQPDGAFWTVDALGVATRQGQLTVRPGPMTWDAGAKVLLVLSGNELVRIDPVTRSVLGTVAVAPEGFEACGIARGPGDRLFVAEKGTGQLFVIRLGSRAVRPYEPAGEAPAAGCLMTVAKRP